jgi:hypothetical protein
VTSTAMEELLLLLKVIFLVLLYLFIWRIVRTASRDVRVPQESFVLTPQSPVERERKRFRPRRGRLVVVTSSALPEGEEHALDSVPITFGRGPQNDVPLERDDFASVRHARFDSRADGVWVEDVGSTNGTYVNGVRLRGPRRLSAGDVVRIGETDLRFEP